MCGIICIYGETDDFPERTLTHRGPDDFSTYRRGKCYMEFTRLSINDLSSSGHQPFVDSEGMLICNGEIYNHLELGGVADQSDCRCLMPYIQENGIFQTAEHIDGVFALCYHDGVNMYAARDPIGIRPMFYVNFGDDDTDIAFASEVKSLLHFNKKVNIFPPGYIYDSSAGGFVCYYQVLSTHSHIDEFTTIHQELTEAVRKRVCNTERPIAFLLSGGLDSSIMAAVGKKILGKQIKTFSIGIPGSPDCVAAKQMADHLGSDHTEVTFNTADGIAAIPDVIQCLETYDTTTIRASIPMWFLLKYISENTDCKVIISGEGSDELFGGYLYFHYAPSFDDFQLETVRRVQKLHQYDVLRADRCAAGHGLEVRVPFLDKRFVDYVVNHIKPEHKMTHPEKFILRNAFVSMLPHDIVWRQKDAFSDAVGYSWVDKIKQYMGSHVDGSLTVAHNQPKTKEEVFYRRLFAMLYHEENSHLIQEIWRTKWTFQIDPSAKYLSVHEGTNKSIGIK